MDCQSKAKPEVGRRHHYDQYNERHRLRFLKIVTAFKADRGHHFDVN
jgi:hypothetical protein